MTDLKRRIIRLETTHGVADGMAKHELSDEAKEIARDVLTRLHPPALIEQMVSTEVLSPRALSPMGEQQLSDCWMTPRCRVA